MRWLAFAVLVTWSAWAGTSDTLKVINKRAEAERLARSIADGAPLNQALNRIHFLGQEHVAAVLLAQSFPNLASVERRRDVMQALAELRDADAGPTLLDGVADADTAVRMWAATGAGRLRLVAAGPALAALLVETSPGLRREAARALGLLRQPRYGAVLARAAAAEGDPEVRAVMLVACGQCGDRRQVAGLEAYLTQSSESARQAAAQGLVLLGSPRGFAYAKAKLASSDRYERMAALALFDGVGAKAAAPLVAPLLDDEDRRLAAQAARVLYDGGDRSKLEWLVLQSYQANGEERLPYEEVLERLRLTDEQRAAILRQKGIVR